MEAPNRFQSECLAILCIQFHPNTCIHSISTIIIIRGICHREVCSITRTRTKCMCSKGEDTGNRRKGMIWDMVVDEEAAEVGVDVEDAVVEEEEEMEDVESLIITVVHRIRISLENRNTI